MQDEWEHKNGCELPEKEKWVLDYTPHDIPTQNNDYDCGVFVCMFADFLSQGLELNFHQAHIPHCRQRIALSIMKGEIIG